MRLIRNPKIIGILLACLIVIVIIGLVIGYQNPATTKAATPSGPPAVAVVEITSSGFLPQTIAINPNTEVIWVNEDVMPHLPAADPYPSHRDLPNLVAPRALGQKETYSFLFTKPGVIPYHDDLNPPLTGTIEVR